MKSLTKDDKKLYLTIFHDLLLCDIHELEEQFENPAMFDYQISILEQENPGMFTEKIQQLRIDRERELKVWEENQKKLEKMQYELSLYEKHMSEL